MRKILSVMLILMLTVSNIYSISYAEESTKSTEPQTTQSSSDKSNRKKTADDSSDKKTDTSVIATNPMTRLIQKMMRIAMNHRTNQTYNQTPQF